MSWSRVEVLFTPAEFAALRERDLSETDCVVIDVLRATSSMATALANGADAVVPVEEIADALAWRKKDPAVLLAGERDGLRIGAELAGGEVFDFGNSPREFATHSIHNRQIVITTTNGTRALRACSHGARVVICSFLNLNATMRWLQRSPAKDLLLVCGGTFEEAAYEDVLCAGAMVDAAGVTPEQWADSALLVQQLYETERTDLSGALSRSRNGRRLLSRSDLADDVAYCAQLDALAVVGVLQPDGRVRKVAG